MDEIRQSIGFDASEALSALDTLDKALQNLEGRLSSGLGAFDRFNKMAGKTVAALRQVGGFASQAVKDLEKVAKLQSNFASATAAQTQKATVAATPPDLSEYIQAIQQQFQAIPKAATVAMRRAYQSAVVNAASYAQKMGMTVNDIQQYANSLGGTFTGAGNTMANKLAAVNHTLGQMRTNVQEITVDFKTMARIVTTQAIVRALSTFRDALRGAIRDTVDFNRRVAEIGTISGDNPNLGMIKTDVIALSNQLNQPFETVAEGYYQTLSNQVGGAAESLQVLGAAGKLAKVSVSSVDDSILLLTGAMNSFGKNSNDADRMAAQFFKTIELGQTRASLMVASFGQTMPAAAELGVALEELEASLVSITIGGQSTARASTEIRAVLTALIKPSEAGAKALKRLGYESGADAVAAIGLVGALQAMREEVGGSIADMGRLFPNVRALNAALRLTSEEGAIKFTQALDQLQRASSAILNRKFRLIVDTDVEKVTADLNKMRNFFATDFGDTLMAAAAKFLAFVGGANTAINALRSLAMPITAAIGLVATFGAGLTVAAAHAKFFTSTMENGTKSVTAMGKALTVVGGALAAWSIGDFLGRTIGDAMWKTVTALRNSAEQQLAFEKELARARLDQEKVTNAKTLQEYLKLLNEQRKAYFDDVGNARQAMALKETVYKQSVDAIVSMQKDRIRKMVEAEREGVRAIESSLKRIESQRASLSDTLFQHQLDQLEPLRQFGQLLSRSSTLSSEAARKLSTATTPEQFQSADEAFRRAEALTQQAYAIGKQADNRAMMNKADEAATDLVNKRIAAEKQYQNIQDAELQRQAEAARRGTQDLWGIEAQQKKLDDALKTLGEKGISDKVRQRATQDAQSAFKEIQRLFTQGGKLSVTEMLRFDNLKPEIERQLKSIEIREITIAPEALAKLVDKVNAAQAQVASKLPAGVPLKQLTGMDIESHSDATKALKAFEERKNAINEERLQLQNAQRELLTYDNLLIDATKRLKTLQERRTQVIPMGDMTATAIQEIDEAAVAYNKLITRVKEAVKDPGLQIDAVEQLKTDTEQFLKTLGSFKTASMATPILELNNALSELDKRAGALDKIRNSRLNPAKPAPEALKELDLIRQIDAQIGEQLKGMQQVVPQVKEGAQSIQNAVQGTDAALINATQNAQALADAFWNAALQAETMAYAASSVPSDLGYVAHGGMMQRFNRIARYFDGGGFVRRGTDTIPAMLTPGETVINAASSRRFYSQLQAINAGVQPVFRSDGGTVTNIGDINVTVKGGDSGRQTARQIASELRRELRRGTSRL
jgi:TP901 family phage tail tape measure protein